MIFCIWNNLSILSISVLVEHDFSSFHSFKETHIHFLIYLLFNLYSSDRKVCFLLQLILRILSLWNNMSSQYSITLILLWHNFSSYYPWSTETTKDLFLRRSLFILYSDYTKLHYHSWLFSPLNKISSQYFFCSGVSQAHCLSIEPTKDYLWYIGFLACIPKILGWYDIVSFQSLSLPVLAWHNFHSFTDSKKQP